MENACKRIKTEACPHCGCYGMLILHGSLFGCEPSGNGKRARRGQRLYCSNRGRKKGCGRTISLRLAQVLPRMRTHSGPLWQFLRSVMSGMSVPCAWKGLERIFSLETGYRYRRRFRQGLYHIRKMLCRERAPPCSAAGDSEAMLAHLEAVLGSCGDLICRYQLHFQQGWPG